MKGYRSKEKHGPEWHIQQAIIQMLRQKGWHVEIMHASALLSGIPDLFAGHPNYGGKWIEVKNPVSYHFTPAQRKKFPVWNKYGIGIWILGAATKHEYMKLFDEPNFWKYWR